MVEVKEWIIALEESATLEKGRWTMPAENDRFSLSDIGLSLESFRAIYACANNDPIEGEFFATVQKHSYERDGDLHTLSLIRLHNKILEISTVRLKVEQHQRVRRIGISFRATRARK